MSTLTYHRYFCTRLFDERFWFVDLFLACIIKAYTFSYPLARANYIFPSILSVLFLDSSSRGGASIVVKERNLIDDLLSTPVSVGKFFCISTDN